VSVARFIADQRTMHRVPHAFSCRVLSLSESWFYKWHQRPPTAQAVRRAELDAQIRRLFDASRRSYGSPRIFDDLVGAGWSISVNTVADSMRRQGLQGESPSAPRA